MNGDGEVVPTLYPAPALGTYPVVEADFAFRRFDSGDLLLLCSSNLGPLLDEAVAALSSYPWGGRSARPWSRWYATRSSAV